MLIYGVALLATCLVIGMLVGQALGATLGIDANVGGVGIAMLLLVIASNSARFRGLSSGAAAQGIQFWSAMYIPIVVAMAAQQNVAAAASGGLLALVAAGVAAVVVSFLLVPVISKIGRSKTEDAAIGRGAMIDLIESVFIRNSLVVAFAVIGVTLWFSYLLADKLTAGRVHGSAIAIALGLLAAYWGGTVTGGTKGRRGHYTARRYRVDGRRHAARFRDCVYRLRRALCLSLKKQGSPVSCLSLPVSSCRLL